MLSTHSSFECELFSRYSLEPKSSYDEKVSFLEAQFLH